MKDFELKYVIKTFDFLTSEESDIKFFVHGVNKGIVKESKFLKKFEKIKSNKYTEEEAKIIVTNLIETSHYIPRVRTDYHIPSNEALLYVLKFIDIEGSSNLKIIYSLLPRIMIFGKKKNYINLGAPRELHSEFYDRLYYLSEKDKKLDLANNIKALYQFE